VVRGDVCHQATVERFVGEYQVRPVLTATVDWYRQFLGTARAGS
jgi:hypothetical protein